jgi:energy-coupling factor transporter transmembrane protein EcfT
VWSLKYIHFKNGATVFLALLILLTLVGGGIGHIILYLPTWAFATRVNKPLDWWKRKLSVQLRKKLASVWIYFLMATLFSWLIVMELGIFGYFPGQIDPDTILNIVYIFLFSTVILTCITFICAIAGDTEDRKS